MRLPIKSRIALAGLAISCLATAGAWWWACCRDGNLAFLPARSGAEWIVYPKPHDAVLKPAVRLGVAFRRSLALKAAPTHALVTLCAFEAAAVTINDQAVPVAPAPRAGWKSPITLDVTAFLHGGSNVLSVWVTNFMGPPALWLRLRTGGQTVATDETWESSRDGVTWAPARLASKPPYIPPANPAAGGERMGDSLKRAWPAVALVSLVSLLLVLSGQRWGRALAARTGLTLTPERWCYLLLAAVLIARAALFVHNVGWLPRQMGFDAPGHLAYVQFIQERGSLPWPTDGVETYHRPLYYLLGSVLLDVGGCAIPDDQAIVILRAINGLAGLLHCWLVLLCLRLLFPKNFQAQAAGLLLVAFLPPHIYLSQYVTNEPLSAMFVTLALYLCLRALKTETPSLRLCLWLGVALGAAMLTKVSALLAIPILLAALALRLLECKRYALSDWLRTLGAVTFACVLVCGWQYALVWAHTGRPLVANWEPDAGFAWWQDPGYRTGAYYLGFGQALVSPVFSGFHTFADSLYSTLWGDGLVSGMVRFPFRPPWNYDLLNASSILALGLSLLFAAGLVLALTGFVRRPTPEWLAVLGLLGLFAVGLLFFSLIVPGTGGGTKAFYAFPALVPFTAVFALAWSWLAHKHRAWQAALWVLLLVWTSTVCAALWIRSDNPETYLVRGLHLVLDRREPQAIESLSRALQMDDAAARMGEISLLLPSKVEALYDLGELLRLGNRPAEAEAHLVAALKLQPLDARIHRAYATLLNQTGRTNEAICEWEESLKLEPGHPQACLELAGLLCRQGRTREAAAWAGKALAVEPKLAGPVNDLAWTLATDPDDRLRNGPGAVALAEQDCRVTDWKQPVLIGTLAAAYAEAGRFDAAVRMAGRARDLAREAKLEEVAKKNEELLLLYRQGKPYRENGARQ